MSEQAPTLQPVEDLMPEKMDIPQKNLHSMESPPKEQASSRSCSPWRGAHAGAGLLAGAVSLQSVFYCSPWKGPTLEQFLKNCSPWEGPTLEKLMKDCVPWEGAHAGAREQHEEEGVAEPKRYEQTETSIPSPPFRRALAYGVSGVPSASPERTSRKMYGISDVTGCAKLCG